MASLNQLTTLGQDLVILTGQHEHQQLTQPDWQLWFVDQYGGLADLRQQMSEAHVQLQELVGQAARLNGLIKEARARADLYDFQAREISAAKLNESEDIALEEERQLARDAEKIYTLVHRSYERLYGQSGSVIDSLAMVQTDLKKAASLDGRLTLLSSEVEDAGLRLDDAARGLHQHLKKLTFDPSRLQEIEERLAMLSHLKRKYGPTLTEVIQHGQTAATHLENLETLENEQAELGNRVTKARNRTRNLAEELHHRRRAAAEKLTPEVTESLRLLGMPHLQFTVSFPNCHPDGGDDHQDPGPAGYDQVEFLLSPNIGEDLKPLARIASGGELSRIMLGLRSLKAGRDMVQTLVFDEVDSGIGGVVAEVVGRKLKELAAHHQLICITHLPQISAFGRRHYHVFKEVRAQRTVTEIKQLSEEERVAEIARMFGGARPTDITMAAAEEMLAKTRNW
ncbi:MAG: DNA repair protein RecN [Deltaproteobacteria bacterium]|nr:DNA repair protein RecN [Deltaproteobacteria bacterium]